MHQQGYSEDKCSCFYQTALGSVIKKLICDKEGIVFFVNLMLMHLFIIHFV